ncbi:MAG: peptidylprolyl isomerase [Oscillospiraceae bacterium]|nr:peptidylprolyl isomerase [Oscillospiraceae bacterium]
MGYQFQIPQTPQGANPVATITFTDGGVITAELRPDVAPNSVCNFIKLANEGYFAGKIFHRVIPNFMIQGGSPNGDGLSTGFKYAIPGEFSANGWNNTLSHKRGVLSMARMGSGGVGGYGYNTASCQFFICNADSTFLDPNYAAFGVVLTGMDVVDRITALPRNASDKPLSPPVIQSVTVDTKGLAYPEPVTVAAP